MGNSDNTFIMNLRPTFCCTNMEDLYDAEIVGINDDGFVFLTMDQEIQYCPFCGKKIIVTTK